MLFIGYIGTKYQVQIDDSQLAAVLTARSRVVAAIKIEHIFSVVAEAFLEYERYNINIAIETAYDSIRSVGIYDFVDRVRQKLNLNVLSFLTAAGAYRDQLPSLMIEAGHSEFDVEKEFTRAFDKSFEYRIMQALRNHSVHHALPIGGFSFGGKKFWSSGTPSQLAPARLRHSAKAYVRTKDLTENPKLNKKTRTELEDLGKAEIDLNYLVRGYIEDLFLIHGAVRKQTASIVECDLPFCAGLHERYKLPSLPSALLAVWQRGEEADKDVFYVDASSLVHLPELRMRWIGLGAARRKYVSSELTRAPNRFPDHSEDVWIDG